jgi:hypothetical protein
MRLDADVAELVRATDGAVIATAPLTLARVNPTRRTAKPGALLVRVRGRRATVRWRGEPQVRYVVAAGARQRANALRPLARTRPARRATFRAHVRLWSRDRWVAVTGYRRSGRGPTAYARIPRGGGSARSR